MVDPFDSQFAQFSKEGGRTPRSNPGGSNLVQKRPLNKLGQYRTASEGTPVLAASNFDNAKSTNLRNSGDGGNGNSSDRKRSVLGGLFNKPSGGGLLGLRKGSDKDRSGSSASIV